MGCKQVQRVVTSQVCCRQNERVAACAASASVMDTPLSVCAVAAGNTYDRSLPVLADHYVLLLRRLVLSGCGSTAVCQQCLYLGLVVGAPRLWRQMRHPCKLLFHGPSTVQTSCNKVTCQLRTELQANPVDQHDAFGSLHSPKLRAQCEQSLLPPAPVPSPAPTGAPLVPLAPADWAAARSTT